jgi:hypothetical protein
VALESILMLLCNGSLERHEEGVYEGRESNVEAPCSASRERGVSSGKSLISCHLSELRGARVIESMAISRLSKSPALGVITLSARRALSLTSALEALESLSPYRIIRLFTPC